MMKYFIALLLVISSVDVFCQVTKIKVEKEKPKPLLVNFAGISRGNSGSDCSLLKIKKNSKLRLINNSDSLKIMSFEVAYINKGYVKMYMCKGDSLSDIVMTDLSSMPFAMKPKVYIDNIKAVDRLGKVKFLTPLSFKLTE